MENLFIPRQPNELYGTLDEVHAAYPGAIEAFIDHFKIEQSTLQSVGFTNRQTHGAPKWGVLTAIANGYDSFIFPDMQWNGITWVEIN